jgi:hypothetical protein
MCLQISNIAVSIWQVASLQFTNFTLLYTLITTNMWHIFKKSIVEHS